MIDQACLQGSRIAVLVAIWIITSAASVMAEEGARPREQQEQTLRAAPTTSRRALIMQARASVSRASDSEVESDDVALWYASYEVCGPAMPALIAIDTASMILNAEFVDDDLVWETVIRSLCGGSGILKPALHVAETAAVCLDLHKPTLPLDPEFPDSMVVATVNGVPISVEEVLEQYTEYFVPPRGQEILDLPQATLGNVQKRSLVRIRLQKAVGRKLKVIGLKESVNQEQLDELEEDVERLWTKFASGLTAHLGVEQEQQDYYRALLKGIFIEEFLARNFDSYLKSKLDEPTSRELHDYYDDNMDDWAYPAGVQWQEISVLCGLDEPLADVEARARDLLAQLQAGADFSELARKHSEGVTKAKGGVRGWTPAGAFGCQEDEDFLFSAPIGATSKVIRGRDEFHIVRLIDRREAGRRSYGEVKPKIRATLRHRSFSRLRRETMQKLLNNAEIVTVFGDEWEFDLPAVDQRPPE